MRRVRAAATALAVAGLIALVALVTEANPGGFVVLDTLAHPLPWGVAFWAAVAVAVRLYRPRRVAEWLAVVLLAVVAAYSLFFAWLVAPGATLVARTTSGGYELRLVRSTDIDAEQTLRLRSRRGLLSRERTVWTGSDLREFRFTAPNAFEVVTDDGQRHTRTFG